MTNKNKAFIYIFCLLHIIYSTPVKAVSGDPACRSGSSQQQVMSSQNINNLNNISNVTDGTFWDDFRAAERLSRPAHLQPTGAERRRDAQDAAEGERYMGSHQGSGNLGSGSGSGQSYWEALQQQQQRRDAQDAQRRRNLPMGH